MRVLVVTSVLLCARGSHGEPGRQPAIVFRWERLPDASAYLLEIAEDESFAKVVMHKRVARNYYRWKVLGRRGYFWRVRAIDAQGRLGDPGEPQQVGPVVTAPEQRSPAAGIRVRFRDRVPSIQLTWTGSPGLSHGIVEISTDRSFRDFVGRHVVRDRESYSFRPPGPGTYHWRVAGVDLHDKEIPAASQRELVVFVERPRLLPARPSRFDPTSRDASHVALSWTKRPVSRYEIQIAQDRKFAKDTIVVFSQTPSYEHVSRSPGSYYWRVRGREPVTAWSRRSQFSVEKPPARQEPLERTSVVGNVVEPQRVEPQRVEPQRVLPRTLQSEGQGDDAGSGGATSLYAATSAGLFSNLGEIRAPRLDVEIGFRASRGSRDLRLGLRGGVFAARESLDRAQSPDIRSRMHSIPIALTGTCTVLPGQHADWYAGGGAVVAVVVASIGGSLQPTLQSRTVEAGVLARTGLIGKVGPGKAFIDVDYARMSVTETIAEIDPGGVSARIGYLVGLW